MKINIFGNNIDITPAISAYVNDKVSKLDKYLSEFEPVVVDVFLKANTAGKGQDRYIVEATITMPDRIARCEEVASDMYGAIDIAQERMEKKLRRLKDKEVDKKKRVDKENIVALGRVDENELAKIVKRKSFDISSPMSEDDAIDTMELLGHDFYFFLNKDTGVESVVYRRRNGGYGVIQAK